MIKVEKRKPIPTVIHKGRTCKYPWYEMEVGDSFYVEGKKPAAFGAMRRRLKKQMTFTTRTEGKGCRVWRTA